MDELLHKVMANSYKVIFHRISGVPVPYYYAENRLYAFRMENGIALAVGDCPLDAWERLMEGK